MTLLRCKEIRAMRPDDLKAKFKEINDELMHEKGVAAMGGAPASPGRIRALRTEVARIHTIMRETQLAEQAKAGPKIAKERKAGPKKAPAKENTKTAAKRPTKEETK
jgi:large subunit ribosomal protein L29